MLSAWRHYFLGVIAGFVFYSPLATSRIPAAI